MTMETIIASPKESTFTSGNKWAIIKTLKAGTRRLKMNFIPNDYF